MELSSHDKQEEVAFLQTMAHIGSWQWNLQTNERSWSDEFYRICGLPLGDERLNAETALEFIHPEDRESAMEAVNYAIENQIPYNYEKRIVKHDGTIRHIIAKGKAAYDQKGEPVKWE